MSIGSLLTSVIRTTCTDLVEDHFTGLQRRPPLPRCGKGQGIPPCNRQRDSVGTRSRVLRVKSVCENREGSGVTPTPVTLCGRNGERRPHQGSVSEEGVGSRLGLADRQQTAPSTKYIHPTPRRRRDLPSHLQSTPPQRPTHPGWSPGPHSPVHGRPSFPVHQGPSVRGSTGRPVAHTQDFPDLTQNRRGPKSTTDTTPPYPTRGPVSVLGVRPVRLPSPPSRTPSSVRTPLTRESSRPPTSTLQVHPRPTDTTPGQ